MSNQISRILQISVFIENKPGKLLAVTGFLAEAGVNIHALSIADTSDFGIIRMIVSEPVKAKEALKEKGLNVKMTEVVAVPMGHTPGSLHSVLTEFERLNVNIEYLYAFTSRITENALVILRLKNQDDALARLDGGAIKLSEESLLDKLNKS